MRISFIPSLWSTLLILICVLSACRPGSSSKSEELISTESTNFADSATTRNFPAELFIDYDTTIWTEIVDDNLFSLDIRYASKDNFMKQKVYDCGRCFLENQTYEAFLRAADDLFDQGYRVMLYDCYRPKPYQQRLWDIMPNAMYVTPPSKGSMHSRGRAVDMSLISKGDTQVDMGTDYDFFGKEAHYDYPNHSTEVKVNRKLLRETMLKYGFKPIRTEWWHFSYIPSKSAFSDWVWPCDE